MTTGLGAKDPSCSGQVSTLRQLAKDPSFSGQVSTLRQLAACVSHFRTRKLTTRHLYRITSEPLRQPAERNATPRAPHDTNTSTTRAKKSKTTDAGRLRRLCMAPPDSVRLARDSTQGRGALRISGGEADWVLDPQASSPLESGSGHNHRATSCFVRSAPNPVPVSNSPIQDTVQIPKRSSDRSSESLLCLLTALFGARWEDSPTIVFVWKKGCWDARAACRVLLDGTPDLAERHLRSKQELQGSKRTIAGTSSHLLLPLLTRWVTLAALSHHDCSSLCSSPHV